MKNNIQALFFDLFFTLVIPKYSEARNEYDVLNISQAQWELYAEDFNLYTERASGKVTDPMEIIRKITGRMNIPVSDREIQEIAELRIARFRDSIISVDPVILDALRDLKDSGLKLCLVSNADVIDAMHWQDSPLSGLFDEAVFSYEVGVLKPQPEIYQIALAKMNTEAQHSVFIGDGGSDELQGAKSVGMKTILAGHLLKREKEQLSRIQLFIDYCIQDIGEVKGIVLG